MFGDIFGALVLLIQLLSLLLLFCGVLLVYSCWAEGGGERPAPRFRYWSDFIIGWRKCRS